MNIEIDVEQFAKDIKAGKSIGGANGALGSLIKQLTEAALAAEIDSHLAQDLNNNRRNGYSSKTMKSDHGTFELDVPRDRNGNFEPEIVKKNQTTMTSEIEELIKRWIPFVKVVEPISLKDKIISDLIRYLNLNQ